MYCFRFGFAAIKKTVISKMMKLEFEVVLSECLLEISECAVLLKSGPVVKGVTHVHKAKNDPIMDGR